jgi:hypothetical protein
MVFFLKQGFERFAANDYMRRRFPQALESKTSWSSTQREFPPHLFPGKVATLFWHSSCSHSSEPLQVSEVDGASNTDVGLQREMVGAQEATRIPRCAKSERGRVFRLYSAYTDWELGTKTGGLVEAALTRECTNIAAEDSEIQ